MVLDLLCFGLAPPGLDTEPHSQCQLYTTVPRLLHPEHCVRVHGETGGGVRGATAKHTCSCAITHGQVSLLCQAQLSSRKPGLSKFLDLLMLGCDRLFTLEEY